MGFVTNTQLKNSNAIIKGKLDKKVDLKYDDSVQVKKLSNTTITMAELETFINEVNRVDDHVVFNVSAFKAMMFLCTIYLDQTNKFCRIADQVTGIEKKAFYKGSDTLQSILNGISTSGKHYTFVWNKVQSKGTRLNDAANITTTTTHFGHFGSVDANYDNPFDSIYPWSERKLCNIDIDLYRGLTSGDDIADCVTYWEGDDGFSYDDEYGVWVYTPAFFGRTFEAGNDRYFDVTDELTQGNISYPAMITGRWHGARKTLTIDGASKTCFLPLADVNPSSSYAVSTMHTEAKNWGATLADIYKVDASLLLMVVEYCTMNSQNACGSGVSSLYRQSGDHFGADSTGDTVTLAATDSNVIVGAIFDIGTSDGGKQVGSFTVKAVDGTSVTLDRDVTVTTANFWSIHGKSNTKDTEIGSKSGYIGTNGKSIAYYRGEELWANLWQYVLGAYRQQDTGKIFICDRDTTDNYDALNTSVHHDTGLTLPTTSGYIQTLGIANGLSVAPFCTAVGGSSSDPVGDYYYVPSLSTVNTILLLGGCPNNGAYDGSFYGYWRNAASDSSWGISARPALKNP